MQPRDETSSTVEPFATEPAQLKGCGKPAVVGCLALLLIVLIGLLVLVWRAKDLLQFAVNEYRTTVEDSLPESLSVEERDRLDRAFDAALEAIGRGDLEATSLQRLQRRLVSPPRPGETMDREDVMDLIEALEAVGGVGSERDGVEEPARTLSPLASVFDLA